MNKQESNPTDVILASGNRVVARDGEELGHVAEVTDEHFRLDVSGGHDYWLSKQVVASTDGDCVWLNFDGAQLEGFKLEKPEAVAGSPILEEQTDVFRHPGEQEEKRRQMQAGHQ